MRATLLAGVLACFAGGDAAVARAGARASPRMSTASKSSATDVESATSAWNRDAWVSGYRTAPTEDSYTVECASLPADLVGTFFRNAPAKFEVGDQKVMHPFDADGMVSALTLDGNGKAHFRNRFVRTRGFVRERQEGKMLYPGTFGNPRGFWNGGLETKNVANTNVLWWGGRLLALWEGGRPHLLDHISLATSRESDLAGLLKPGESFSAHPRFDVAQNRLVNFAYAPNPLTGTKLTFFEFGPDFRPLNKEQPRLVASIPGFCLVHDFALTANYYVVTQAPTSFDANPLDVLLGNKAIGECIAFDASKPTTIWLIPRNGAPPKSFSVPTHFAFHHANAYEDAQGRVVLDSVCSPTLELGRTSGGGPQLPVWEAVDFRALPYSRLARYTLDPKSGAATTRPLCDRHVEFPSVHPRASARPHRFIFAATGGEAGVASPMRGVLKVDTSEAGAHQLWLAPEPTQFVGEPLFAPKAGAAAEGAEDDGYVLLMMLDGARESKAALLVLDAADVGKGPIATVELDTYLPHGLHGTFVPGLAPTGDEIEQATTLMNMYARKSREWNVVDGSFSGMGFKSLFQKGVDGR